MKSSFFKKVFLLLHSALLTDWSRVESNILSMEERRPSVFIACTVCSFVPDGTNCSFLSNFVLTCKLTTTPFPSVSWFTPTERFHNTSDAGSKRGGGCVCVKGGRCDVSVVQMGNKWKQ